MNATKPSPWSRWGAVAVAGVLPAAAAVLYWVPPDERSFYPRCMFHQVTGLHCPGCGATRCLHALVHGDLPQAAAYNVFFLVVLPFLVVWAVRWWYSAFTGRPLGTWRYPAWFAWAFLGVTMTFWVVRNLPFPPFDWLAPHPL